MDTGLIHDGPCQVDPGDGGSFTLRSPDDTLYVFVRVDSDGAAEGYWNQGPMDDHPRGFLGLLRRDGACWVDPTTEVCAWK